MQNSLLPILANFIRLHDIDPTSVPNIDNNSEWVDALISTSVLFYISIFSVITDHNLNN